MEHRESSNALLVRGKFVEAKYIMLWQRKTLTAVTSHPRSPPSSGCQNWGPPGEISRVRWHGYGPGSGHFAESGRTSGHLLFVQDARLCLFNCRQAIPVFSFVIERRIKTEVGYKHRTIPRRRREAEHRLASVPSDPTATSRHRLSFHWSDRYWRVERERSLLSPRRISGRAIRLQDSRARIVWIAGLTVDSSAAASRFEICAGIDRDVDPRRCVLFLHDFLHHILHWSHDLRSGGLSRVLVSDGARCWFLTVECGLL